MDSPGNKLLVENSYSQPIESQTLRWILSYSKILFEKAKLYSEKYTQEHEVNRIFFPYPIASTLLLGNLTKKPSQTEKAACCACYFYFLFCINSLPQ